MNRTMFLGALAAALVSQASLAQIGTPPDRPNLSGQYDGWSDPGGLFRLCPIDEPRADCREAPLTTAGAETARAFDYDAYMEQYGTSCTVAHMPAATDPGRYLLGLYQQDDVVNITYQRTDTIRAIRMTSVLPPEIMPHTRLGYSVGSWDDDVLVVVTTHLTGGYIGPRSGLPYSEQATVTERFWLELETAELNQEVTLEDPVNYTEPFVMSHKRFEARPEWDWTPWNCSLW